MGVPNIYLNIPLPPVEAWLQLGAQRGTPLIEIPGTSRQATLADSGPQVSVFAFPADLQYLMFPLAPQVALYLGIRIPRLLTLLLCLPSSAKQLPKLLVHRALPVLQGLA